MNSGKSMLQDESIFISAFDVFLAPKVFFEKLKYYNHWGWFALIFSTLVYGLIIYWFFQGMSIDWVVEQQMSKMTNLSPAAVDKAHDYVRASAHYSGLIAGVNSILTSLIISASFACYYKIISQSYTYSYSQWFSFSLWTMMPALINGAGLMVLISLTEIRDVPLDFPNYASLNQIFLKLSQDHFLYNWAESLNLFDLWAIVIAAFGLQTWVNMKPLKSFILAFLPYLTVMGIWLLILLY